ncbi:hypothetical protein ABZY44_37255, partial [Streptomyces sp. NPDC006544]
KLVSDITYLPTLAGWWYLATVIDLATREVIGYAMVDPHRAELVTDAPQRPQLGLHRPLGPRIGIHIRRIPDAGRGVEPATEYGQNGLML